jgi:hypothetical protein
MGDRGKAARREGERISPRPTRGGQGPEALDRSVLLSHARHRSRFADGSPARCLLHGYRPFQDEPLCVPLPDPQAAQGLLNDSFDGLVAMLADTRLGVEVRCDSQASGWGGFG